MAVRDLEADLVHAHILVVVLVQEVATDIEEVVHEHVVGHVLDHDREGVVIREVHLKAVGLAEAVDVKTVKITLKYRTHPLIGRNLVMILSRDNPF